MNALHSHHLAMQTARRTTPPQHAPATNGSGARASAPGQRNTANAIKAKKDKKR